MARANQVTYERFALLLVQGKTQIDAFLELHPHSTRLNAGRNAFKFARRPQVQTHLRRLLNKSADRIHMNRQEVLDYLANAIRTPAGSISENHPLCQAIRTTKDGTELKMPDKLGAAALLAKMQGWNEPERHELSTTTELTVLLETLRGNNAQTLNEPKEIENNAQIQGL